MSQYTPRHCRLRNLIIFLALLALLAFYYFQFNFDGYSNGVGDRVTTKDVHRSKRAFNHTVNKLFSRSNSTRFGNNNNDHNHSIETKHSETAPHNSTPSIPINYSVNNLTTSIDHHHQQEEEIDPVAKIYFELMNLSNADIIERMGQLSPEEINNVKKYTEKNSTTTANQPEKTEELESKGVDPITKLYFELKNLSDADLIERMGQLSPEEIDDVSKMNILNQQQQEVDPIAALYFQLKNLPNSDLIERIVQLPQEEMDGVIEMSKLMTESDKEGEKARQKWERDRNWYQPWRDVKGEIWKGWNKNIQIKPKDLLSFWWRDSEKCFEVDHICQMEVPSSQQQTASHEWKWFYYTPSSSTRSHTDLYNLQKNDGVIFQPSMELKGVPLNYGNGGGNYVDRSISIVAKASSSAEWEALHFVNESYFVLPLGGSNHSRYHHHHDYKSSNDAHNKHHRHLSRKGNHSIHQASVSAMCHILPTSNHFVVQSLYNDMMAEFYGRTVLRLYELMKRHTNSPDDEARNITYPWEQDIQFYVHIAYGNKKILDGHKLFLSGMLTSDKAKTATSFAELFKHKEKQNDGGNEMNTCQCFKKMVFCGYDIYDQYTDPDEKNSNMYGENATLLLDHDEVAKFISKRKHNYTLWPSYAVENDGRLLDDSSCDQPDQNSYKCKDWNRAGLRNFLTSNIEKNYPTLEEDIITNRRQILLQKGWINQDYTGDTKEWNFVGLSQRTSRRSWLNLAQVITECDNNFFNNNSTQKKVVCTEVNIENTFNPYEQLILHRSLNVLIGVHGSQLTQALLLPYHSHVLELLPWIPEYITLVTRPF